MELPVTIISWIEDIMDAPVASTIRVPGGASREAWFIDVEAADLPLFLRYDRQQRSREPFHPVRVEAEVFNALSRTGVAVPRILAVHPCEEAMLAERVAGQTWFYRIQDPHEQVQVAQDFIRNLAALHRLDPSKLALPSLGEVRSVRAHVLEEISNMRRRATGSDGAIEPVIRFSLDWLEANVPDYEGPTVLVQGDTGPGNFLYEHGRVTAVVDWELAHFGDPMEDIAWLSLRTVQDTFTHFPDRLAEYAEQSGFSIDTSRVWYYRLFAEARLATSRPRTGAPEPPNDAERDIGNQLIYGMLHRRLLVEALGHVLDIGLTPACLPVIGDPTTHGYLFDECLVALQAIVPRIEDPLAAQWSKGVARVIKYLKEVDQSGPVLAEEERSDLGRVLGRPVDDAFEGRSALASAVADGRVSQPDYVSYLWRQLQREDHLMRHASGALRERTWPPLS